MHHPAAVVARHPCSFRGMMVSVDRGGLYSGSAGCTSAQEEEEEKERNSIGKRRSRAAAVAGGHNSEDSSGADLGELLLRCASDVAQGDWERARATIESRAGRACVEGDAEERVAAHFVDAVVAAASKGARIASGNVIRPCGDVDDDPPGASAASYLAFNQVAPYIRFAHLTANQAILEALDREGSYEVHVVDLDIMQGLQWPPFMQALVMAHQHHRQTQHWTPLHPPRLRITAIAPPGGAQQQHLRTGHLLSKFAAGLQLPFEFTPVFLASDTTAEVITRVITRSTPSARPRETLVINCMLLHAHSAWQYEQLMCSSSAAAAAAGQHAQLPHLLSSLRSSCSPTLVTLAEKRFHAAAAPEVEAGASLAGPMREALCHFSGLFESLEATLPPSSAERTKVERVWLRKEIMSLVSCIMPANYLPAQRFAGPGAALRSWRHMLQAEGFEPLPQSSFAKAQAKLLLRLHYPSEGYQLGEDHADSCLVLGWQQTPLFTVSAWN